MASIEKRGQTWSVRFAYYQDGKRKHKRISGFESEREAKYALLQVEEMVDSSTEIVSNQMTIKNLSETFLDEHVATLAGKTQHYYKNIINTHIVPGIGKLAVVEVKPLDIQRFYRSMEQNGHSSSLIHHCHVSLRTMLNKAVKWGYIDKSPMINVPTPKKNKKKMQIIEPYEVEAWLKNFKDTPIWFHVNLSLKLGLRQGEICALHERDVDFVKKTITISNTLQYLDGECVVKSPKTAASNRTLPMSADIEQLVRDQIKKIHAERTQFEGIYQMTNYGYLSVHADGHFMQGDFVTKKFQKLIKYYDIKKIRFHDLRHSCASWLLYNNVSMQAVQAILGHSSYRTTADTYTHIVNDELRNAVDSLKTSLR